MDDRSKTDSDVEIVNEAPAEDATELDNVEQGETDKVAEEITELDDTELVSKNDTKFNDSTREYEADAEEVTELDETDVRDSQSKPTDVPVLRRDPADTHTFEHGLRRDPADTPTNSEPKTPDFPPPPPEAPYVMPAVIDNDIGNPPTNGSKNPEVINSERQDMEKNSEGKYY